MKPIKEDTARIVRANIVEEPGNGWCFVSPDLEAGMASINKAELIEYIPTAIQKIANRDGFSILVFEAESVDPDYEYAWILMNQMDVLRLGMARG